MAVPLALLGWLGGCLVTALLAARDHSFLTAMSAAGTGCAAGLAVYAVGRSARGGEPPLLRRPGTVGWTVAIAALAVAFMVKPVYLATAGRTVPGEVLQVRCPPDSVQASCFDECLVHRRDDGRSLGWLPCDRTGLRAGDRAEVRVDPLGCSDAELATQLPSASIAWLLAGAGGVLLFASGFLIAYALWPRRAP